MTDRELVESYEWRHQAETAVQALESNGIHASILSDDCGGADPLLGLALGGVKVVTSADKVEEARHILVALVPRTPTTRKNRTASEIGLISILFVAVAFISLVIAA